MAGNLVSGNNGGFLITGSSNVLESNYIGTDVNGTADLGNATEGIEILFGANNTIGGTGAGEGNLISGNNFQGIDILGNGAYGNVVQGNFIGTDVTGTQDLGNSFDGVIIESPSPASGSGLFNTVGGTAAGARNVISGNGGDGIETLPTDTVIQGNYIGTDVTGTVAIPNSQNGVLISGLNATGTKVGGTAAGAGNVISGNTGDAVEIGSSTLSNFVQGNLIGLNAAGASGLGNGGHGVFIGGSSANVIGVGGANTIAFNLGDGVFVSAGTGNTIRGNSIYSNSRLGIDLGVDGVTANDAGDGDTGANTLQNFPVLTSATTAGGNVTISGTLNSTPSQLYTLEFFANAACDATNHGEGETPLGIGVVTTDGSGNASFSFTFSNPSGGNRFTSTATNQGGNTSEFSACVQGVPINCALVGTTLEIDIPANGAVTVSRDSAGNILVAGAGACAGSQPTVTNVDLIDVDGAAGSERLTIDMSAVRFAPGFTDEGGAGDTTDEIEWTLADVEALVVVGSAGIDVVRFGSAGVNFSNDTDADVTETGLTTATVNAGMGNDVVHGVGAFGADPAWWASALLLNGEDGNDRLHGGLGRTS